MYTGEGSDRRQGELYKVDNGECWNTESIYDVTESPKLVTPGLDVEATTPEHNGTVSYAKLIRRALLSTTGDGLDMTVQEIYAWLEKKTTKVAYMSQNWRGSVRHNLSLNMAFSSYLSQPSKRQGGKKVWEWRLEPFAKNEVTLRKGGRCVKKILKPSQVLKAWMVEVLMASYTLRGHHSAVSNASLFRIDICEWARLTRDRKLDKFVKGVTYLDTLRGIHSQDKFLFEKSTSTVPGRERIAQLTKT
ncbi:uncharacterized protein B0I36DRAFT_355013 [Microdochium trichocladiopsis]|uniref:Fork-head domain-containing protein n=1 Tax=Microdochium trichocladiopsis TaxID=1682393 RepID=A0A9P9BM82_9PEZI|nr:uncharacterized protein B0I36DRAFT_355013 [Microdochium trichocladiopsis]KAH7016165.1 hypothetical protein B0I36DRAFT_355013 [Microdochium trichocladiopsis]